MRTVVVAGLMWLAGALSGSGQDQDRPSFTGTWQFDASKSEMHLNKVSSATWVIEEGDNSIHLAESDAKGKKTDLQCTTDGKECKFPGDRRDSFWYSGVMLVDMETKNDHVIRYRLKISTDGKTLTVEVTNVVPPSEKMDTMVFQKQ
jgi:hypothetical protein